MWRYRYADELYHHGIKGQKWGVRRFQNSDGSLTAEGKKRYNNAAGDPELVELLLMEYDFKQDKYGNYVGSMGKKKDSLNRDCEVLVNIDSDINWLNSDEQSGKLTRALSNIEKNFTIIDKAARESAIKEIYNDQFNRQTITMDKTPSYKDFYSLFGTDKNGESNVYINIYDDGIGELVYDDGEMFGGHYFSIDIDLKTGRLSKNGWAMNG